MSLLKNPYLIKGAKIAGRAIPIAALPLTAKAAKDYSSEGHDWLAAMAAAQLSSNPYIIRFLRAKESFFPWNI